MPAESIMRPGHRPARARRHARPPRWATVAAIVATGVTLGVLAALALLAAL